MEKFKTMLFVILFLLLSCSSLEQTIVHSKLHEYHKVLDKHSQSTYKYIDLFEGRITLEAVFISAEVKEALQKDMEKNKLKETNIPFSIKQKHLAFLVAFYHHDKRLNDLAKKKAIWNVTLKNSEKSYKATKITKLFKMNHKVFKTYFKNNQRFSSFYLIEFDQLQLDQVKQRIKLIFSSMEATLNVAWRL